MFVISALTLFLLSPPNLASFFFLYAEFVLNKGGWLTVTYIRNFCLSAPYVLLLNSSTTIRFYKQSFLCSQGYNSKQKQVEKGISVHLPLVWMSSLCCVWQEWIQGLKMPMLEPLHLHCKQFAPLLQSGLVWFFKWMPPVIHLGFCFPSKA